jgi:hypothetical protein
MVWDQDYKVNVAEPQIWGFEFSNFLYVVVQENSISQQFHTVLSCGKCKIQIVFKHS